MRRMTAVALFSALASGCGSVFGLDDLPPLESEANDGGAPNSESGTAADGGGRTDGTITGDAAIGTDPRWALWPIPPDDPSAFVVDDKPSGRVITDSVTRLEWEDPQEETSRSIEDARTYCADLVHGGYDDWRMPTRIELVSILRVWPTGFESAPPAFTGIKGSGDCQWTGSIDSLGNPWSISGGVGHSALGPCWFRCVRGGPPLGEHKPPVYAVSAQTVVEPATSLHWERTPPDESLTREAAAARCGALTLDGHAARLPTIKELLSIVDEERTLPAHGATFAKQEAPVWSSTVSNGSGWLVDFTDGKTIRLADTSNLSVASRCVAKP